MELKESKAAFANINQSEMPRTPLAVFIDQVNEACERANDNVRIKAVNKSGILTITAVVESGQEDIIAYLPESSSDQFKKQAAKDIIKYVEYTIDQDDRRSLIQAKDAIGKRADSQESGMSFSHFHGLRRH